MGAGQIRIAGDVPHPGNGRRFEGWDRYEAAVNTVWHDLPVWGLCLYDITTTPPTVLDVVERTHPRIVSPSGQRRENSRYQDMPSATAARPRPCASGPRTTVSSSPSTTPVPARPTAWQA